MRKVEEGTSDAQADATVHDSVHALKRFSAVVKEFRSTVRMEGDGVAVGRVHLGNDTIRAPIDCTPEELNMGRVVALVHEVVDAAGAVVATTQKALAGLGVESPAARDRCAAFHVIASEIDRALQGGPPWHPRVLAAVLDVLDRHLGPGDPVIRVPVTVWHAI